MRDTLAADVLRIDPKKLRVVTPDVGGGFGTKLFTYREYALVVLAAQQLKRPVRWIAERTEHFLGDAQGRDNITTARLALDDKGRFLALDIDIVADMGAYLSAYAPYIPYLGAGMSPGVYDIPACYVRVRGAYTNTVPVDAYRGAGPSRGGLCDRAAGRCRGARARHRAGRAAAEELHQAEGDAVRDRDRQGLRLRRLRRRTWRARRRSATGTASRSAPPRRKRAGLIRGIGLSTYIEACGTMGPDTATITLDSDGGVTVLIGSQSSGQGHATAYAQIIADQLGVAPGQVRMVQGDTDRIATGTGTGGSSSIPCGGASLAGASEKLAENLKALAADALEASAGDLELADGAVRVVGTDRAHRSADLAKRPDATPDKLTAVGRLRAAGADLSQRHACRRGRDRSGDRRDPHRQLRGGRRLRRDPQSAAAGRAGARRRRAGHRPGADGADGLRSGFRPARHRLADGLCAAERRATFRPSPSRRATCRA